MFFLLKRLVEALCQPFVVGMGLAVVGFVLCQNRRRARAGRWAMALGLLVLLVFGYPVVPGCMQRSLAARYKCVTDFRQGIDHVVVLAAGGFSLSSTLSVNSRANSENLVRFMEGVRVHRALPGSRIVVSVSAPNDPRQARQILDELAALLGVAPDNLVPVVGARDTRDEARLTSAILDTNAFYLVTSDWHMPRAMMIFRQAGLHPIAAPAGRCGRKDRRSLDAYIFPRADNFRDAEQAFHEYLGMGWAWVTGGGGPRDQGTKGQDR